MLLFVVSLRCCSCFNLVVLLFYTVVALPLLTLLFVAFYSSLRLVLLSSDIVFLALVLVIVLLLLPSFNLCFRFTALIVAYPEPVCLFLLLSCDLHTYALNFIILIPPLPNDNSFTCVGGNIFIKTLLCPWGLKCLQTKSQLNKCKIS